jgi:glutamyl-tRNA synthetase
VPEETDPAVVGDGSKPAATGDAVRCRFAPSPTGELHVGNARTALFSWLTARHHGGTFVLRVEDTDKERSTDEAIGVLIHSLRWLEIDWDEGPEVGGPHAPYRQTEGLGYFADVTERFLQEGRAYPCYCTPGELEDRRRAALKRGETPGYDGRCRSLSPEDRAAFEREGRPFAVRFAMPGNDITVHDLIRGETTFPASDLKDFVIMRSNGIPTYLLAAAADDVRMGMTHIIRGEDLMPSTPRQVEIVRAMGAEVPAYAHLPLIVGPGGQKLSKRTHAASVERFHEDGFLPEALVNYMALLGWSKDASTTFLSRAELVAEFDVSHVSRNPAVFDLQKLEWLNGHYIREASDDRLATSLAEAARTEGLDLDPEMLRASIPLIKERMRTLKEGLGLIGFLFTDRLQPDEKAQRLLGPERAELFREAATRLEALADWRTEEIHALLETLASDLGLSKRNAFQPIRAAVTGATVSPPLPESIHLLGRERTLARLRAAAG